MKTPLNKIRLSSSGGLANLEFNGELGCRELPETLVRQVEQVLEKEDLPKAEAGGGGAVQRGPFAFGAADTLQYQLTVEGADGKTRRFAFDELAVSPEVLDLLDALKAEMLRRRREAAEEE